MQSTNNYLSQHYACSNVVLHKHFNYPKKPKFATLEPTKELLELLSNATTTEGFKIVRLNHDVLDKNTIYRVEKKSTIPLKVKDDH